MSRHCCCCWGRFDRRYARWDAVRPFASDALCRLAFSITQQASDTTQQQLGGSLISGSLADSITCDGNSRFTCTTWFWNTVPAVSTKVKVAQIAPVTWFLEAITFTRRAIRTGPTRSANVVTRELQAVASGVQKVRFAIVAMIAQPGTAINECWQRQCSSRLRP